MFDFVFDLKKMILILLYSLFISFIDFICWVPMFIGLLFRKFQFCHPNVTSDIPG